MPAYDASKVAMNYSGVQISGFGPDTFVSIEYNSDTWTLVVGADGEGVRAKSSDLSAKITITLMESSLGNEVFMAALAAGMAGAPSAFPLIIVDGATLTSHASEGAWVVKPPNKVYSKEGERIEWMLECVKLIPFMGTSLDRP